jgi:hypothetical protein
MGFNSGFRGLIFMPLFILSESFFFFSLLCLALFFDSLFLCNHLSSFVCLHLTVTWEVSVRGRNKNMLHAVNKHLFTEQVIYIDKPPFTSSAGPEAGYGCYRGFIILYLQFYVLYNMISRITPRTSKCTLFYVVPYPHF